MLTKRRVSLSAQYYPILDEEASGDAGKQIEGAGPQWFVKVDPLVTSTHEVWSVFLSTGRVAAKVRKL